MSLVLILLGLIDFSVLLCGLIVAGLGLDASEVIVIDGAERASVPLQEFSNKEKLEDSDKLYFFRQMREFSLQAPTCRSGSTTVTA